MTDNDKPDTGKWDDELKPRERKFVVLYCTDDDCFMNGRKAFTKANTKYKGGDVVYMPKDSVADAGASRLLSSAKVKSAVRRLLQELQPDVDAENIPRLLHDMYLQATYNPADIITSDGSLVTEDLHDLGDLAKCIAGIKTSDKGYEVKLYPRQLAQEKLMRYYNLVREHLPDGGGDSMRRVILARQADSIEEWNRENAGDDGNSVETTA